MGPAKLFFEKGFDNIYLLTGGLEEFHSHHPDFVEGKDIPWPIPLSKIIFVLVVVVVLTYSRQGDQDVEG